VISVILTTYERRTLVARALASVFSQTLTDREVIVVDDGSTDDTVEFLGTQPVTLIRLAHSGNPAVVRNAGLKRAQGELITFLDSDDVWRPTALAELVQALYQHPEGGFAYCDYAPPLLHPPPLPVAGDIFNQLLGLDFIVTSGVLVRRSVAETVGVFDPRCSPAEDWDYWLRMAARFLAVHVPQQLVAIGAPPDSLSRAPGGVIYRSNIRVTRKALSWCLANRCASAPVARRAYRRSRLASARYRLHRRAIARTMHDLVMMARGR
jgi:glycosyltransferase involved in cell wall biosynthesis